MKIWLNVAESAEYAGVCRDTIYTACERAELRHIRIGGRRAIRLKREWIDEWLERHTRRERDWQVTRGSAPRAARWVADRRDPVLAATWVDLEMSGSLMRSVWSEHRRLEENETHSDRTLPV